MLAKRWMNAIRIKVNTTQIIIPSTRIYQFTILRLIYPFLLWSIAHYNYVHLDSDWTYVRASRTTVEKKKTCTSTCVTNHV